MQNVKNQNEVQNHRGKFIYDCNARIVDLLYSSRKKTTYNVSYSGDLIAKNVTVESDTMKVLKLIGYKFYPTYVFFMSARRLIDGEPVKIVMDKAENIIEVHYTAVDIADYTARSQKIQKYILEKTGISAATTCYDRAGDCNESA